MTCEADEGFYAWRLVAGDDSTRTFAYQDSEGAPINLTGYTAELTYDVGLVSGTIAGTVDELAGTVTVTLPDELTTLFRGSGEFRLRITSGGGSKLTLAYGDLVVKL